MHGQPRALKMSARGIVTLDDAGRDRFIQENRPSDDGEVFIDLVDMLRICVRASWNSSSRE